MTFWMPILLTNSAVRSCRLLIGVLILGTSGLVAQTESELLEEALRQQGVDAQKTLELYEAVQAADGFNEAEGYRLLGETYPEYQILQAAEQQFDAALTREDPAAITQLAVQLARVQGRELQYLNRAVDRLRQLPPSDSTRRAAALLLLERAGQYSAKGDPAAEQTEVEAGLEYLQSESATELPDPLDWIDPELALELLLRRYRAPLGQAPSSQDLQDRLIGLEHCLQLLHSLRLTYDTEKDRLALAAAVPPLAYRAVVIALQLQEQQPAQAPQWSSKAFQIAEQAKATLLADQLQGYQPDRQATQWPRLGEHLQLARRLALEEGDFFAQPTQLKEAIQQGVPGLESWPLPPERQFSVTYLQEQLDEQSLLISYFMTGEQCLVFTLNSESIHTDFFTWAPSYQRALDALRAELSGRQFMREPEPAFQRFSESANLLYETILLRPALKNHSHNTRNLILLPDAVLWDLPFDILLTEEVSTTTPDYRPSRLPYLIQSYSLSYAPSAEVWLDQRRKKSEINSSQVAAFAPTFGGQELAERQSCGGSLAYLAHNTAEVEAILEHWPGSLFLGEAATTSAFLQASRHNGILHLATHACRNEQSPEQSQLFFQDGAFSAREIANTPLPIHLAVLSACETQSGQYHPGEGVLSIGRAFLQAGSRSLMGSLWPVSDAATAELIPLFYAALSDGIPNAEALQAAKLAFLDQQDRLSAHPHYWAGFVLIGQNETIDGSSGKLPWYWLVGGFGAIFLIFGRRKRTRLMRKSFVVLMLCLGWSSFLAGQTRIAILNFQQGALNEQFSTDLDAPPAGTDTQKIQDYVTQVFFQNDRFTLIDRSQIRAVRQERELQKTEDFLDGYIVEQFNAAGADYLLVGQYQPSGRLLNLRLIKVSDQSVSGQLRTSLRIDTWRTLESQKTKIQDATRQLIQQVFPVEIPVVKILDGNKKKVREVLIAGGSQYGLKSRQILLIKALESVTVEDETVERAYTIAEIKVEEVENEHFSRCSVETGGRGLKEKMSAEEALFAIPKF